MKRLIILVLIFTFSFACSVFALNTKANVQNISENNIKINLNSDVNIKVTGYTINKGSNIVVYYIFDDNGNKNDSITVDLNTVARPYTIKLINSNKGPFVQPFKDIADHPMKDYIRHLYDLGHIEGYKSNNTFRPDNNITRAEMITLMVKMFDLKENKENRKHFVDLNKNHWAYKNAIKAVDNGIIDGYLEDNKRFIKLDKNITIAEASKLIYDVFEIKDQSKVNYDVRFVNHWAKSYIQSLLNASIISAQDAYYEKGEINRPITRGEVAMLISRALGR